MTLLLTLHILAWVALVALALVNLALIRQVGVLYERVAPSGALALNKQLKVGQAAPNMNLQTLSGDTLQIGGIQESGRAQLLFFLSPDCPVCKTLLPGLKSAMKVENKWVDLVVASDGVEQDHHAYVTRQRLSAFPYIVSESLGKTYGVNKLPYAVLIDEQGKIASLGIVNTREHIDSLFEAKERKVASIQAYLRRKAGEK